MEPFSPLCSLTDLSGYIPTLSSVLPLKKLSFQTSCSFFSFGQFLTMSDPNTRPDGHATYVAVDRVGDTPSQASSEWLIF